MWKIEYLREAVDDLKKLGLRIVYRLVMEDGVMKIIVISARAEDEVYITAQKRINK
jgi:mRNA interferase RelE/StbE